jgi:anti-anti-sigma factor
MNDIADLHIERQQDTYIAVFTGEIDPTNARDLGRQLTTAVPNDAMAVVVDLTEVQYIDSSGVQLLFELAERLAGRQQKLAISVPPTAPARRVLDIVALDATAPVTDTRDEALQRVASE